MKSSDEHLKILIAEDCPISRKILVRMMEKNGLTADCAENGRLAVDKTLSGNYAIVFMDVFMPEMNGIDAVKEIRRKGIKTCVMALSGSELRKEEYEKAGFDGFVLKPVEESEVLEILKNFFLTKDKSFFAEKEDSASCHFSSESFSLKAAEDKSIFDKTEALELAGDEKMLVEILKVYVNITPVNIRKLRDFLVSADLVNGKLTAHLIRGESKSVGAKKLFLTATEIENASKNGELGKAAGFIDRLGGEFEEFIEAVKKSGVLS